VIQELVLRKLLSRLTHKYADDSSFSQFMLQYISYGISHPKNYIFIYVLELGTYSALKNWNMEQGKMKYMKMIYDNELKQYTQMK